MEGHTLRTPLTEQDVVRRYEQTVAELKEATYSNFRAVQIDNGNWTLESTADSIDRDDIDQAFLKFKPLFRNHNSWKTVLEKVRAGTPAVIAVMERE